MICAAQREVRYGITSLPPDLAPAARLLELKPGHWMIENGLHYVKDLKMGEDRSLRGYAFWPRTRVTANCGWELW